MAKGEPYDARTLRYVAGQLAYAGEVTARSADSVKKAELRHWANEYRLEARRITTKKKRKGAGDSSR